MRFEQIELAVDAGVAVITLNRPDRLNAYTRTMATELAAAIDATDADPDVKAVIITGAGRGFCAGFELEGSDTFAPSGADPSEIVRDLGGLLTLRLFESVKPLIAVINGPAVGIGATMLLPMDYRIASDQARFGFIFTRRGIVPEAASSWFLPRLVGIARALDWMLSGRVFGAQEALEGGLVAAVLAPDAAMAKAHEIAQDIVRSAAPVSVSLARQMLWQALTFGHPMEAHRMESRLMHERGGSRDALEGVGAFLEKRPPAFPDRVPDDLPPVAPWRETPGFS